MLCLTDFFKRTRTTLPKQHTTVVLFSSLLLFGIDAYACQTNEVAIHKNYPTANFAECAIDIDGTFDLLIEPEDQPINPSPWYGFMVSRSSESIDSPVTVRLNYEVTKHRYPPKWSLDGVDWHLLESTHIEQIDDYTLAISVPTGYPQVYLSAQPILDSEDYTSWLNHLDSTYPSTGVTTVGYSIGKKPIRALLVNERAERLVLLLGRQHPPEVTGALAFMSFTEHLLNEKSQACLTPTSTKCQFFRQVGFVAIPLLNPDGVDAGYWRHNMGGRDLNRDWFDQEQPETQAVLRFIARLSEAGKHLIFHLDFHSTNRDVLYVQMETEETVPSGFAPKWLSKVRQLGLETLPEYAPRPLTDQGTAKSYFFRTYGIPSITYEVGDNTNKVTVQQTARTFAEALIQMGDEFAIGSSLPSPLNCESFFCHMLDANASSLLTLVEEGLIDQSLGQQIARAQLDIHRSELPESTNYLDLEAMLIEQMGSKAANVHIGRSRQDLHGITRRMITRQMTLQLWGELINARNAVLEMASKYNDTVIPAYTHGVPSQPVSYGHVLVAFDAALSRDLSRIQAAYGRMNLSQLGVAAGSGSGYPMNREALAENLGFDDIVVNSFDGNFLSTSDYKLELSHVIAQSMLSLTKLLANVHAQQRDPLPWIFLSEELTSGSSIMPQKRNPRPLDRLRTKIAGVLAAAEEQKLLNLNLDTGMHDYRQISSLRRLLAEAIGVYADFSVLIKNIQIDAELANGAIERGYSTTTELADTLYREAGVPFRDAHEYAKQLTNYVRDENRPLSELTEDDFRRIYLQVFESEVTFDIDRLRTSLTPQNFLRVRDQRGETAPNSVQESIAEHREQLVNVAMRELAKAREHLSESRFHLHQRLQELAETKP